MCYNGGTLINGESATALDDVEDGLEAEGIGDHDEVEVTDVEPVLA